MKGTETGDGIRGYVELGRGRFWFGSGEKSIGNEIYQQVSITGFYFWSVSSITELG